MLFQDRVHEAFYASSVSNPAAASQPSEQKAKPVCGGQRFDDPSMDPPPKTAQQRADEAFYSQSR